MSQYEYYEFQAVDRRLTEPQMHQLRGCSSRAQITPTSFTNEYHFGSFKGDKDLWMEKYFDGYIYNSNWGTRVLMLALPATVLSLESVQLYCSRRSFSARAKDGRVILAFTWHDENYENWVESSESLSPLLPLRTELGGGDHRSLYIGWLLGVQNRERDREQVEPPVPPNLAELSPALECLVEFLRVDRDLLEAAAEGSTLVPPSHQDRKAVLAWVKSLSAGVKDDAIAELVDGEPAQVAMELRARFSDSRRPPQVPEVGPRRTAGELAAKAEVLQKKRQEASARAAEAQRKHQQELAVEARKRHLDSLAGREPEIWSKVDELIALKQSKSYDEAIQHLKDLRELAVSGASLAEFQRRIGALRSTHPAKRGLLDRLQRGGF